MYVCMYVCMYIYKYVSRHVCRYVCMYVCMFYICMQVWMYVYERMYLCLFVCNVMFGLMLRCLTFQNTRDEMFIRIEEADDNNVFESLTQNDKFQILMGARVEGINVQQMEDIWLIGSFATCGMYKLRVKSRKGVG